MLLLYINLFASGAMQYVAQLKDFLQEFYKLAGMKVAQKIDYSYYPPERTSVKILIAFHF